MGWTGPDAGAERAATVDTWAMRPYPSRPVAPPRPSRPAARPCPSGLRAARPRPGGPAARPYPGSRRAVAGL
ncbi:WD40 repeat domain-containing protein, partial [Streptomyces rhizosphaericola]